MWMLCFIDVHPFFKTFGPRQFLYYVINYLLCLSEHKERRLDLSREELLVVTAMAFREESHTPVRFENVRPSIRCFTVSSWFQVRESGNTRLAILIHELWLGRGDYFDFSTSL